MQEIGDFGGESLQDYLCWQMQLILFFDIDLLIVDVIIDVVNDDGFLCIDIEDICNILLEECEIELDEVEVVLYCIQNFDFFGVVVCSVQESL